MTQTYRAQFRGADGKHYWRYFQELHTLKEGSPAHTEWHTSRMHDRGYYQCHLWTVEKHDNGIIITVPPLNDKLTKTEVIVGYPYDHEEEQRIAVEAAMDITIGSAAAIEKAAQDAAHASQVRASEAQLREQMKEPIAEFIIEVSHNHVWLSGPGALVRISEIACALLAKELSQGPNAPEKTLIILKNGAQITLDLPLEVFYGLIGSLAPANG